MLTKEQILSKVKNLQGKVTSIVGGLYFNEEEAARSKTGNFALYGMSDTGVVCRVSFKTFEVALVDVPGQPGNFTILAGYEAVKVSNGETVIMSTESANKGRQGEARTSLDGLTRLV